MPQLPPPPDPSPFGLTVEWCRPIREHALQIMEWRNDPHTLAMSFNQSPKQAEPFWEEYQREYFKHPEAPPFFTLLEGVRAGFLRFHPFPHPEGSNRRSYSIGINVNPSLRGKGVGVRTLRYASEFLKSRGVEDIVAEIRVQNGASVKSFESAGYTLLKKAPKSVTGSGECCEIFIYLKRLT